jgi:putative hemolysin
MTRSFDRPDTHAVPTSARAANPRLTLSLARTPGDIEDAQRLRYKVFAEEMGATLPHDDAGLDRDEFDAWCDHLIVRDADTLRVVGTYRILPPHRARRLRQQYADGEFDLTRLAHLRAATIEVGRSCVHRDYRNTNAILLLWAGLAGYMRRGGYRHLIGCASAPLGDGGKQAARLRDELLPHFTDGEMRAFPRVPFPHEQIERAASCVMPPLIKGYLRLGARICGEPAWDPDFNTADFLVWLALDNLEPRYARHFNLLAAQAGEAAG